MQFWGVKSQAGKSRSGCDGEKGTGDGAGTSGDMTGSSKTGKAKGKPQRTVLGRADR